MAIDNNKGGEYSKYFIQDLQEPSSITPEYREFYNTFAKRILWLDSDVCPGAFQMNTAWYCAVPSRDPVFPEHEHPYSEIVAFYGSNPDDPYDLGGVVEFGMNGEMHRLTRSTMIFCPANVLHSPIRILEVKRPIFHFSVVMNDVYAEGATVYK